MTERVCPYGDPTCPCQDGDPCHYEDLPGSPAMTPPEPCATCEAASRHPHIRCEDHPFSGRVCSCGSEAVRVMYGTVPGCPVHDYRPTPRQVHQPIPTKVCEVCKRAVPVSPCECHRRPGPGLLWKQAESEHPDDIDALRRRYHDLMVEHGHLIPGKQEQLPCGWKPDGWSDR